MEKLVNTQHKMMSSFTHSAICLVSASKAKQWKERKKERKERKERKKEGKKERRKKRNKLRGQRSPVPSF